LIASGDEYPSVYETTSSPHTTDIVMVFEKSYKVENEDA
jgi:hypothetical protein